MNKYGLIGYPLSHSFSKRYFTEKFAQEAIPDSAYELFPLEDVNDLPALLRTHRDLVGLNVTIPYKQRIIPMLDRLDPVAERIGAVNTIKIDPTSSECVGYNSDYYGFKQSVESWLAGREIPQALVLGTGGASRAVVCALQDLNIAYTYVSRQSSSEAMSYERLRTESSLADFPLIINTTPLGMSPQVDSAPNINYQQLSSEHFCYDLVYNPDETLFMRKSQEQGVQTKNGLEMLRLQAEKSWEIWR